MLTCDAERPDAGIQNAFSGSELPDSGTSSRSCGRSCESEGQPPMAMDIDEFHGDRIPTSVEVTVHAGEAATAQSPAKGNGLPVPSRKRAASSSLMIKPYLQAIRNTPGVAPKLRNGSNLIALRRNGNLLRNGGQVFGLM